MAFKKVKKVEWDKVYIVNRDIYVPGSGDKVVSGVIGSVEDFKADYLKRFKIEAATVEIDKDEEVED